MTTPTNAQQTVENYSDFFGVAKLTGGSKFFAPEDGDNEFRVAPPVKQHRHDGVWFVKYNLHYGYTIPNPKDAEKPFGKPFLCIEQKNWDTGMITQECPECTLIRERLKALEAEIDRRKQALMKNGMDEAAALDQAGKSVQSLKRWFRDHNIDRRYYMLAKDGTNTWGILKLKKTALDAMKAALGKYTKKTGKDGFDPKDGIWVSISRTGEKLDTKYAAEVAMEDVGGGNLRYKLGPLTPNDAQAIQNLPDLDSIFSKQVLSYDQIKLLAGSDNNPAVTTKIFKRGAEEEVDAPAVSTNGAKTTQTPVAPPPVAPVVDPKAAAKAALLAQIAALDETPAPTPAATTAATDEDTDMDIDAFNKKFGLNQS